MEIKPKRNSRGLRTLGTAIVFGLLHNLSLSAQDDFVYWPRLDFVIPFQIDSNGQAPQEVILEVSDDAGGSWKTCSRGDTRSRQFHYKASQDGAFQFRLKTVDAEGRKFNNPGEPLKIIVDTTKPIAKLRTFMDPQGKMQAEFLLSDKDLDVNSIRLEYQTESVPEWKPIQFAVEESTTINEWTGYGDWNLPNNAKQLVVRIIAKDKAGNTTEEIRLPNLPKTASSKNMQLASQLRATDPGRLATKDADATPTLAIGSGVSNNVEGLPRVEVVGRPEPIKIIEPPNKNKLSESAAKQTDPNTIRAELLQEYQLLVDQQQKLLQQKRIVETQQKLELESNVPTDSRGISNQGSPISFGNRALEGQEPVTTPAFDPTTLGKAASTVAPNLPNQSLTAEEWNVSPREPMLLADNRMMGGTTPPSILLDGQTSFPRVPAISNETTRSLPPLDTQRSKPNNGLDRPGSMGIDMSPSNKPTDSFSRDIKPLYSNTKTFSLDYRVDNEPGAPIQDVELWGTTDQGQTWSVWGSDPDRRTPFDIEVETDGLFGFRMVIIGSNGLASNRPRNGDNADAWIHVDTDTPYAKLTSALYGTGSEVGSLIIEYQAKDEYFGDRPISLFFGETPEGPWQVISRSIRNQGRFAWPADPNLPPTIYLKMEAIDAAGNIATSVLDLPVNVEGIAPRGRIQGFRPIQRQ
jgi:hypothetical protein